MLFTSANLWKVVCMTKKINEKIKKKSLFLHD